MTEHRLVILGAGGFAREVRWLAEAALEEGLSRWVFGGYLVTDLELLRPTDDSAALLGDLSWLDANLADVQGLALGIGNPSVRLELANELARRFPELEWPVLVHPSVTMEWESASIGRGAVVCAGTIGTVNVVVEEFAMVNLDCTLGHEARIGAGSVLNPSVNISGGVDVGTAVLIGTGAQILQYVQIGDRAVVGAGAVVTKNVGPGITVVGVPARPVGP